MYTAAKVIHEVFILDFSGSSIVYEFWSSKQSAIYYIEASQKYIELFNPFGGIDVCLTGVNLVLDYLNQLL